jgi:hypothetical protein
MYKDTVQTPMGNFPGQRHTSCVVQVELYGETLRDLLCDTMSSPDLSIQKSTNFGYHVAGSVTHNVHSGEELQKIIDKGATGRVCDCQER